MIALMHSLCKNPTGKDVDERFFREGGEAYVFKGIGILDAVGADLLSRRWYILLLPQDYLLLPLGERLLLVVVEWKREAK